MLPRDSFSCFIIGTGSLPIKCAEIVLGAGHTIYGMISSDIAIQEWAKVHSVPYFTTTRNLASLLKPRPFDYLFSVLNLQILAPEILELPQRLTINYHDALLPRYAGLYATSWALAQREIEHGVTWHVVTEEVDAGDILKQRAVSISPRDTAFALNLKCYEAAIETFAELVAELGDGRIQRQAQDLAARTYYARWMKPAPGGVLKLNQSAQVVDALVRALDFGPIANPLGLPKMVIHGEPLVIPEIEVRETAAGLPAGTITEIGEDFLELTTADFDIRLRKALTLSGESLAPGTLVERFNLNEGGVLADSPDELLERIKGLERTASEYERFWIRRLEALETLSLPYPSNSRRLKPGAKVEVNVPLPSAVSKFLEDEKDGASAAAWLVACLGAFLARVADVSHFDLGFATPELTQSTAGIEAYLAPIVPLRLDVEPTTRMSELAATVTQRIAMLAKYQTFATDLFLRTPSLRALAPHAQALFPIVIRVVEQFPECAKVDGSQLTALVSKADRACRWVYDGAQLNSEVVQAAVNNLKVFLEAAVTDSQEPIINLPLLSAGEQNLLKQWNSRIAEFPHDRCIHRLFEEHAARTPDQVAVIFNEQQVTYRELNERANQLAHYLIERGVGPETLVGIAVERSPDMLVGLMGILKAGGAYVPLDPAYPTSRLAFMLEDTKAGALLTQEALRAGLPEYRGRVICLDADLESIAAHPTSNPRTNVTPDNLAYVIYTSGSTGKPKGVMIPHINVVNMLAAQSRTLRLGTRDRMLGVASLSFDASVFEFLQPLTHGGTLILPDYETVRDGAKLAALLDSSGATIIDATPITLRNLVEAGWDGNAGLKVNTGGEAMDRALAEQLLERAQEVWNPYGPTENTVEATTYQINHGQGSVPIGKALANTSLYVLDSHMQPVPIGVVGELYIGGRGVARGYLNRPELTAEKFVPNPFDYAAKSPDIPRSPVLFKTGDRVRYLPDGNLDFVGRADSQIKLRGFRIELGEIKAALDALPGVHRSIVMLRQDVPGDPRLVAYMLPKAGTQPVAAELRPALARTLPDYMLPSAFMMLERFPMLPNGKIDAKALPIPEVSRRAHVAPRTGTEARVAEAWRQVMHLDRVGRDLSFFELGGNSLSGSQIISRLRTVFGLPIPLRSIFECPTVAELSTVIDVMAASAAQTSVPQMVRQERKPLRQS